MFLAVADYDDDQRVAAAMILFGEDAVPSRWERATQEGFDVNDNHNLDVDSARGCYLDLKLARFLYRKAERGRLERYQHKILSQMVEHDQPTWSWANVVLDESSGANLVAFTSGAGDGGYPSFFGLSDERRAICLITDFTLLDEQITRT